MPLPLVPGVLEVALDWTVGTDVNSATKLHFRTPAATLSQADLNTLAGAIQTAINAGISGVMTADRKLNQVVVRDLGSAAGLQGIAGSTATGNRGGAALPANVAVLANYKINRRYRGGKPRSYLPWGSSTDLAGAQAWTTAAQSAFLGQINNVINGIKGATGGAITVGNQCCVHYQQGGTWAIGTSGRPRFTPHYLATAVVDDIVTVSVSIKPASQRRRLQR